MRSGLRIALAWLALSSAACSGVGEGNKPVSLRLLDAQTGSETEVELFRCFEGRLAAQVRFSNGQLTDFLNPFGSRPVRLVSDDPAVAVVSNGEIPVPLSNPVVNYPRGTIIPRGVGSTTIRARFSDLEDRITVTVRDPDAIRIEPRRQTVAAGTGQTFSARAFLDGVETTVTGSVLWRLRDLDGEPVPAEQAAIGAANGLLLAPESGGPYRVSASLSACAEAELLPPTVSPEDLLAEVVVRPAAALALEREFVAGAVGNPNTRAETLVVGSTERFFAIASFADAEDGTHDVSNFARFRVREPGLPEETLTTRAGFGAQGQRNLLQALAATEAPLAIHAELGADDDPEKLISNGLPLDVVAATLQRLRIRTPLGADDQPIPEATPLARFGRRQYTAIGEFQPEVGAAFEQEVRRHAQWSTAEPTVATVVTQGVGMGLVTAVAREPACTRLRALANLTIAPAGVVIDDQAEVFVIDASVACPPAPTPTPAP